MKLKGELDSIGLAELFQTLSAQHATGILSIRSPFGEKHIAIAEGEIAIFSDKIAEHMRIGDLLIAQGKITEPQLAEALKLQKDTEPRAKLGDFLVRKGMITQEAMDESLKFQIEEELYDIFTWKNATFDFDGDKTVEDVAAEAAGDSHMQHSSLDPQALIAEASRRMPDWSLIEERIPTPYLCFKLSPKGEELAGRTNTANQRVVKLLREGRTIETTIKRGCLGRFNTCKMVIKLLDEGWIFPYPANELPALAMEHRAHKRFTDALNIYRRLKDVAASDAEKQEIEEFIDETVESIRRAKDAGEAAEGADLVSHKDAAQRYKRRQRNKRIAVMVIIIGALVGGAYYAVEKLKPDEDYAKAYKKAIDSSVLAELRADYKEAISIWKKFYNNLDDKTSEVAKSVKEQIQALEARYKAFLDSEVRNAEAAEKAGHFDEAEAAYKKLLEAYPDTPQTAQVKLGIERIAEARSHSKTAAADAALKAKLDDAQNLFDKRQYTLAKMKFQQAFEEAPADSPARKSSEEALKKLKEIEDRSQSFLAAAKAEIAGHKAENAIALFDKVSSEWPDLPWVEGAQREKGALKLRLDELKMEISRAEDAEKQDRVTDALEKLRQLQQNYAEFELTGKLNDKIVELEVKTSNVEKKLTEARALYNQDKVKGRQRYLEIMKNFSVYLAGINAEVPVSIQSSPPGATVKVNGKEVGKTPLEVNLLAVRPVVLHAELAGYKPLDRQIPRLDNLEIPLHLERAILNERALGGVTFAPPRSFDGVLYVFHGANLSAFSDPLATNLLWTSEPLFNEKEEHRPNSNGDGPVEFIDDKSWWYPRTPPERLGDSALILAMRSREIKRMDLKTRKATRLASLATEPVGRLYVNEASLRGGTPLVAVATADARIQVFDVNKPEAALWSSMIDKATPAPKGALAAGIGSSDKIIFAISASGQFTTFDVVNGGSAGNFIFNCGTVAQGNLLPDASVENFAAVVFEDGHVTLFDIVRREKVWDLPHTEAMDEALSAVVDKSGVYVITREGSLRKYSRERTADRPALIWKRQLDGTPELPIVAGAKAIYAVSTNGTVYAISVADGLPLWDHHRGTDDKPTQISLQGGYFYICTRAGKLIVFKAE